MLNLFRIWSLEFGILLLACRVSEVKTYVLNQIRMQTFRHRTCIRSIFDDLLLPVAIVIPGEYKVNMYLPYPPGIAVHHLGYGGFGPVDREILLIGRNPHDGKHTTGQGCSYQVSWRKSFAPSLVIRGCIGNNGVAGKDVGCLGAEVASI